MKDKMLIFTAGLLVGAILATGVFMILNKNNPNTSNANKSNSGNGLMTMGDGQPPSAEELEAAEKTIMEDGSVKYQMPNGGVLVQKGGPGPDGASGSIGQ